MGEAPDLDTAKRFIKNVQCALNPAAAAPMIADLIERVRQLEAAQKAYDHETLVTTLIYHWRTNTSGCGCGWAALGASHAEHVADVYEESIAARLSEAEEQRSE